MNNKGIKISVCCLREADPLLPVKFIFSLIQLLLMQSMKERKKSETGLQASDSTIHHFMLFDLKRPFFINNFTVVIELHQEQKKTVSHRGQRLRI